MNAIDVGAIIENRKLNKKEIAKQLFPGIKYPSLALNRVISNDAVLDANQIVKLASLADLPIEALFNTTKWGIKSAKDILVFSNAEFKAEFNTKTFVSKVFHKNTILSDTIISSKSITLSEYLNSVNQLISKYNKNGKH